MPSIRYLCPVISASLGLANVERWAEVMAANGQLSLDGQADENEVAALVLAVLAAPAPEQSTDALQAITGSELVEFRHEAQQCSPEHGRVALLTWPDPAAYPALIDTNPIALIVEMLADVRQGLGHLLSRMVVGEMGSWVGIELAGTDAQGHRWSMWLKYSDGQTPLMSGAARSIEIAATLLTPVAEAMRCDEETEQIRRTVPALMSSVSVQ